MSVCYYCHWGWPKPIVEIYQKHLPVAGFSAMHFGPSHIVWEDENFDRESVLWCLEHGFKDATEHHGVKELYAVKLSLQEMLTLPDSILDGIPKEYDDENPANFPPPWELGGKP